MLQKVRFSSTCTRRKMFLVATLLCFALAKGNPMLDAMHAPQPYKFGYSVKDHQGEQHREEASDGAGGVVGSYGYTDHKGVARQVNYVADHAGFRAQVKTNEPGTANQNPAAVKMISDAPMLPYHGNVMGYAEPVAFGYSEAPMYGAYAPYAPVAPMVAPGYLGYDGLYGGYGVGYSGMGYKGALGYSGLLGGYGVNYATPLMGGAIKGYDSRYAKHMIL